MPILEWSDSYSVGVEVIDNEHKQLIAMINKAYDSVKNMEEDKVLVELVQDMLNYAETHFSTEEKLMAEYGYPAEDGHLKIHKEFTIKAQVLDHLTQVGSAVEPLKVFKFLADWLRDHILKTDKELGKFLNEQGLK